MAENSIMYFGYASNLLKEKLALRSPSAEFVTIAKLKDYRLIFESHKESGKWHGAMATIDESPGDHVWGAVYRMQTVDLTAMDKEEGQVGGVSRRLEVNVETPIGQPIKVHLYYFHGRDSDEKRPSPQYLGLIIKGAEDCGMPDYYLQQLRSVKDNGYQGEVEMVTEMEQAEKKN